MAQSSDSDLLSSDDSILSSLFQERDDIDDNDNDVHTPLTDYEIAERLQFQETLYFSMITSKDPKFNDPSSSSSPSSLHLLPSSSSASTPLTMAAKCSNNETCESWEVTCEICAETKEDSQMFINQMCHHSFCSECVTKQVAAKIQENITSVSCPFLDCENVIELDACRKWLPKDLLDRWDQALCEALFLAAPKYYCPFKDCSAMLLVEREGENEGIREAECPVCHRLFCARCDAPWHPGVDCEEYQKLNEDERERNDLVVRQLANEKQWSRCPNCRFIVEKTEGCLHITCRCHYEFCYKCGEQWTSLHGACERNPIT